MDGQNYDDADRAQPDVTIIDPQAATGPADVLAGGREPWRPTGRQVRLAAVTAVMLLAAAGVVAVVDDRRDERALDRAAVQAVRLAASEFSSDGFVAVDDGTRGPLDGPLPIGLRNDGRFPVRVLSMALDGPGYAPVEVGEDISPGGLIDVVLRDSRPC